MPFLCAKKVQCPQYVLEEETFLHIWAAFQSYFFAILSPTVLVGLMKLTVLAKVCNMYRLHTKGEVEQPSLRCVTSLYYKFKNQVDK